MWWRRGESREASREGATDCPSCGYAMEEMEGACRRCHGKRGEAVAAAPARAPRRPRLVTAVMLLAYTGTGMGVVTGLLLVALSAVAMTLGLGLLAIGVLLVLLNRGPAKEFCSR